MEKSHDITPGSSPFFVIMPLSRDTLLSLHVHIYQDEIRFCVNDDGAPDKAALKRWARDVLFMRVSATQRSLVNIKLNFENFYNFTSPNAR